MDAQQHLDGKWRAPFTVFGGVGRNQRYQVIGKNDLLHLPDQFALVRLLDGKVQAEIKLLQRDRILPRPARMCKHMRWEFMQGGP